MSGGEKQIAESGTSSRIVTSRPKKTQGGAKSARQREAGLDRIQFDVEGGTIEDHTNTLNKIQNQKGKRKKTVQV